MLLLLLLPLLLLTAALECSSTQPMRVTDGPADTSVRDGENVTLTCRSNAGSQPVKVFWQRNGLMVAAHSMRAMDQRYSIASGQPGVHDLSIAGVQLQDQGAYSCQLALPSRSDSWPLVSNLGHLRVLRNAPWLRLYRIVGGSLDPSDAAAGATVRVTAGESFRLACAAGPASPAPAMSWTLRDIERVPVPLFQRPQVPANFQTPLNGFAVMTELKEDGQLLSARSELFIDSQSVTDAHHNLPIECGARVPGFESEPLSARTRLYVSVPPRVQLVLEPAQPDNEYREHDNVIAVCRVLGRPENFTYSWSIDSLEPIIQRTEPRLPLLLTRRHDGRVVRCSAFNFARGEAEIRLRVRYGPKFAPGQPQLYAASPSGLASLDCRVDSNPTATIEWRRVDGGAERDREILGRSASLRLEPVGESDFGQYACTASVAGFAPVTRRVILARESPPRVVSAGVSTTAADGAGVSGGGGGAGGQRYVTVIGQRSVRLVCSVNSVPLPAEPDGIRWTRADGSTVEPGPRRRLYREDFVGGTSAYLQFDEVQSSDAGEYNCTADNGLGSDSGTVVLLVEDNIPTAFIAGASIALLMILIFVLVLVCVCKRSRWESAEDSNKGDKRGACEYSAGREVRSSGCSATATAAAAAASATVVDSPAKRLLQTVEDSDDASTSGRAGQALLGDGYPFSNETSSFIPASTCALHGSLLRRQQQQQQQHHQLSSTSASRGALSTSWCPSADSGSASIRFLLNRQPSSSPQTAAPSAGDEAPDEAGQEDSVRSCDSGYGGPAGAASGTSRGVRFLPGQQQQQQQLFSHHLNHLMLTGAAASSGGTAASDSGASSPGPQSGALGVGCLMHGICPPQLGGYGGAYSALLLQPCQAAAAAKLATNSPPLPPLPQPPPQMFSTSLMTTRRSRQPAIAEDQSVAISEV